MSWIAEWIVEGVWRELAEAAYHKAGWLGAVLAVVLPLAIAVFLLWLIVR